MSKSDAKNETKEQEVPLSVILKFIKPFDGSRNKLNPFLTNCDNAISLASTQQEEIIFKFILSQLEDKAESACSIKDFDTWNSLKEFLKNQFGERKHYAHLLTDLQECKQSNNESVNQFSLRIETCLSKLLTEVTISNSKKSELSGRLAAMEELALHTFTLGLHPRLSNIIRCRNPKNLNEAINHAISEEKIQQFSFRNNNTPMLKPRTPNPAVQRFYQSRPNLVNPQHQSRDLPFCRYCKKLGHQLENCRLREHNNKRFNNGSQPFTPAHPSSSNFRPRYDSRVTFIEDDQNQNQYHDQNQAEHSNNNNLN